MLSNLIEYIPASRKLVIGALSLALAAGGSTAYAQQPAAAPVRNASHEAVTSRTIAPGLYEIVTSNARNAVYVASAGTRSNPGGSILELDPATLAVRSSIDVSAAPAYGLGLNDRTQMLYTSNTRDGSVWAIDLRTGTVAAKITSPTDSSAHVYRVLVDDQTNTVYVSIADTPGNVWVIDGTTNKLARVIENTGTRTTGLALDRGANRLYTASLGSNEITAVDLATNKVVATWPSGGERPTQLAFDDATNRLFITNQATDNMTVLDTKTGELLATVPTGDGALGIGFDARSQLVYVANRQAGTVTVVDATSYTPVSNLDAGSLPNTVAIDPQSSIVYVTNKARSAPRGQPAVEDPSGDTVTMIKP